MCVSKRVTTEDLNIPEFLHRVDLKKKTTFGVGQYLHLQGQHQVEDTNHHLQSYVALKFYNLIIPSEILNRLQFY
jgi:hypothetical protein